MLVVKVDVNLFELLSIKTFQYGCALLKVDKKLSSKSQTSTA